MKKLVPKREPERQPTKLSASPAPPTPLLPTTKTPLPAPGPINKIALPSHFVHSFNCRSNRSNFVLPHYALAQQAQIVKREIDKERERQRKAKTIQEEAAAEHWWETSEVERDVTTLGLLLRSADTDQERASDSEVSENDEMLVVKERS